MNERVIAAGHICLDITPVFPKDREYAQLDGLFSPGRLIHMEAADVHTGGSVANTGLALKKLGADVRLLGKIGDDEFGALIRRIAAEHGAGGLIVDKDCSTSYSVVLAVPGYDRIFLHNPGANDSFCGADITDAELDGTELFHFGYPPLMRRMYENDGAELCELFRRVKAKGILTSLDMASVDPHSPEGQADWRKILSRVLPYVDYFVPSLDEIRFMLDRAGDCTAKIAKELCAMGAGTVLIKCGTDGMYYRCPDGEGVQPCFPARRVRSATGAGDTSIAAFLMGILRGQTVAYSAALAAAEGACCVEAYDALSSLKNYDELEEMINADRT